MAVDSVGDRHRTRTSIVASRILWAAAVTITAMCIALFIGLRSDDRRIEEHLADATATVISVSALRTGIEFVDHTGTTIRPAGGVLYPGLLGVGQQFVVEYDSEDPTIVRVAGRTAAVGNLVIAATLVGTWATAGGLLLWLRRSAGSSPRRHRNWSAGLRRSTYTDLGQPGVSSANTSSATSGADTTSPSSGID